jgi:hypothetical protein
VTRSSASPGMRVCVVAPGAPSSNPRAAKEVASLVAAGYQVRWVCGSGHSLGADRDAELLLNSGAARQMLAPRPKWRRVAAALRHRFARRSGGGASLSAAAWAESESVGRLVSLACAEPADFFIGHYLPGLYAAWKAARRHGAVLGFDAEDSHVDELADTPDQAGRREARQRLEGQLLSACRHFTAASPLIAEAYECRYGRRPTTILNVFPKADAPPGPVTTPYLRGDGPPTLYWFSQTVGPGRGLEQVVDAMNRMRLTADLHLRGYPSTGFREELSRRAGTIASRIHWYPPDDPNEMVRLAAGHDLGLALERATPPNRAICLTNKAFTYLLGGLPVVFSRTPAQEHLAVELGAAAQVTELDDPAQTAACLDAWLGDKERLAQSRSTAWDLGQTRFNWDLEQAVFLDSVEKALTAHSEAKQAHGARTTCVSF